MDIKQSISRMAMFSALGLSQTKLGKALESRHPRVTPNNNRFSGVAKAKRAARKRRNQIRSRR